jgi:ABC-2 type transport system permease protein
VSAQLDSIYEVARRSFLRAIRQPAAFVPAIVFPLFLVAVNSAGLDAATDLPGFPTDSYVTFALAIPFIQGGTFALLNTGTDVSTDVETGFMNRLAMTPLGGPSLLAGMLGGAMAIAVIQTVFYIAIGFVVGADFAAGIGGIPLLFLLSLTISFAFSCIGTFTALRLGNSEAMQSMFPVFFVFLFFSSMAMPRDLIVQDWFRTVATINPLSYLIEGIRSFYVTGIDGEARVRDLGAADRRLPQPRRGQPADDPGEDMTGVAGTTSGAAERFWGVARAVAWRSTHNFVTNPALFLPAMIFPLFFFGAFAGGLSGIDSSPGFDYPNGYTAFEFGFVLIQASAFGGVFTGFGIARDFESGFGRRLMLAAPNRLGILGGYAIAGLTRALMVDALLFALALLVGMNLSSNAAELLALLGLALVINIGIAMWAAGIALRFRSIQAGPLMQTPVFLILFLTPVYVPQDLLASWVEKVSAVNPISPIVESSRNLIAGSFDGLLLAFLCGGGLILLFGIWAVSGMRRAEAAGG